MRMLNWACKYLRITQKKNMAAVNVTKFKCIVGRGFLTLPPYIGYPPPPFFKFCPTPPPPLASNLQPQCMFYCHFLWLNGWLHHIWCVILLSDIMDLQMLRLGTLIPEGPSSVFYAIMYQIYWGLAHNVVFC